MTPTPRNSAPDKDDLALVGSVLGAAGLTVHPVPTSTEERCDLRATDHQGQYLVEVKGCHDDHDIDPTLASGEVYQARHKTMYHGTINQKISDAVGQLNKTDRPEAPAIRLVALLVRTAFSPDVTFNQILGTLYGTRDIIHVDAAGATHCTGCLYFAESAFFKHKTLDGALLFDADGSVCLCVNDHGNRIDTVIASGLAHWFAQRGALNDATRLGGKGGYFVADCTIDRKDRRGLLAFVSKKYSLGWCQDIHMEEHSAMCNRDRHAR